MSRRPPGNPRRKRMDHISPILQEVLSRAHLAQGVANYSVFPRWDQVVGAHLAASTRPLRIQGEVLWIHVDNSTLLHHLTFLVPQFLERIRAESPGSKIRGIRFTLNPEP